MRNLLFFIGLVSLASCLPAEEAATPATDSMDPAVSEPGHYKVEFENDQVRVLRITYAAGEEARMHSHPASVAIFLTDGEGVLGFPDGSEREFVNKAGDIRWRDAQSHQPRAKTNFELIHIELEDGDAEASPEEASGETKDATEVEPDRYKVEFENDRVRVVRITYGAGDQGALHSHPDGVLVYLTDGSAEIILEDGTKREESWKAGDTVWAPAETHHGKALTDFELLLVELKV